MKKKKIELKAKTKQLRPVAKYNLHGQKWHSSSPLPLLSPFQFFVIFLNVFQLWNIQVILVTLLEQESKVPFGCLIHFTL